MYAERFEVTVCLFTIPIQKIKINVEEAINIENEIEYGGRRIKMRIAFAQYKHCSVLHHNTIKTHLKKVEELSFSAQHS
jgi:hypothetical protein